MIDKLADLATDEEPALLIFALKCLYRLHMFVSTGLKDWLESMIFHSSPEVRSEAYHSRARIRFYSSLAGYDVAIYIDGLTAAIKDCENAMVEMQNRVDAEILLKIAIALKWIAQNKDDNELCLVFDSAKSSLRQFISFRGSSDEIIYFINIFNTLFAIRSIQKSDPARWLDIKKELVDLLVNMQKMDIEHVSTNPKQNTFAQSQVFFLREGLVKAILLPKLHYEIFRLKQLEQEGILETEQQKYLLNTIIGWLEESKSLVMSRGINDYELFTKFHSAFPETNAGYLKERLDGIKPDNTAQIVDLFVQITSEQVRNRGVQISTGIPTGDEILTCLVDEVKKLLPNYIEGKFIEAMFILRDVINYIINASRGSKDQFGFLFKPDAIEKELQDSMMVYLRASDRSSKYIPEVKDFADGGRVDIVYKSDRLELPIELKRSLDALSWEKITTNYIAQAQTYANTRDQLSIFLTLDLSPQSVEKPELNVKDLFRILTLKGRQDVPSNYPNYVIAFILPGNKILPSGRSKYR